MNPELLAMFLLFGALGVSLAYTLYRDLVVANRIPCVVYVAKADKFPVAVAFTNNYREAKRIEKELKLFYDPRRDEWTGITEAWHWPTMRHSWWSVND